MFNGVKQTKLQAKMGEASLSELLTSKKGQQAPQVNVTGQSMQSLKGHAIPGARTPSRLWPMFRSAFSERQ